MDSTEIFLPAKEKGDGLASKKVIHYGVSGAVILLSGLGHWGVEVIVCLTSALQCSVWKINRGW